MKSAKKKIRVLIADDHPIVREGLRHLISQSPDMIVRDEAVSGQEVLDKVQAGTVDVILLDLNLPGKDGFEVLKALKQISPRPPVLVLSMHSESQVGIRALRAGASGFMNKEAVTNELLDALRKIHGGGRFVSPFLAEKLAGMLDVISTENSHELLSDRELQVLTKIASGKTADQIAGDLFISIKTVRTYRARILEKLHLTNDVDLTHYALQHRLTE